MSTLAELSSLAKAALDDNVTVHHFDQPGDHLQPQTDAGDAFPSGVGRPKKVSNK